MPENNNLDPPIYSPLAMALSKANLDPEKVELAKEWFPPGSSETPGFQEGGSGEQPIQGDTSFTGGGNPLDILTTNLYRNVACVLNSVIMANVLIHCEELQQHPLLSGWSCEMITILLTFELYDLYKKKNPAWGGPDKDNGGEGISSIHQRKWAWVAKQELMEKYGVEIGKKRLSGYTPAPEGDPPTPFPKPQELWILPEHVIAYGMGSGRDDDGGPFRPVEASSGPTPMSAPNPANASDCCPPEGCIVIVGLAFRYTDPRGQVRYTHHQVMGEITKCEPLTIECFESPMQMPGGSYTLTVDHYRGSPMPGMMGDFGFTHEHTVATVSDISGGDQETRDAISGYPSAVIKSIVCFC